MKFSFCTLDFGTMVEVFTVKFGSVLVINSNTKIKDRGYLQHENARNRDVYADLVVPFINF